MSKKFSDEWTPQQTAEEAARIIAEKGQPMCLWLNSVGLTFEDERGGVWGPMILNWEKRGVADLGREWVRQQKTALKSTFKVTQRDKVTSVIARKFAEVALAKQQPLPKAKVGDGKELDILPETIRWVYLHPGLIGSDDESKQVAIDVYVSKNPPPDQGAISRYEHCRDDKKHRSDFFKYVDAILMEEKKRLVKEMKPKAEKVDPQEQAEQERISKLRGLLAESREKSARMPA